MVFLKFINILPWCRKLRVKISMKFRLKKGTLHYVVHSPKNALFINLVKCFNANLKHLTKLINSAFLVSELRRFQNARLNDEKRHTIVIQSFHPL